MNLSKELPASVAFVDYGHPRWTQVASAVFLNKDHLRIQFEATGWHYTMDLHRVKDTRFRGEGASKTEEERIDCVLDCNVYPKESGYFLFGIWLERQEKWYWWAELYDAAAK